MYKDGAAAAGNARPGVVVDLDEEVVEIVGTRQPVGLGARRQLERPIVTPVAWVLAPAVIGGDAPRRQQGCGTGMAVSAPPQPQQRKNAARRGAVAFALVALDAAAAERDRQRQRTSDKHAACRLRWLAPHGQPSPRLADPKNV